MVLGGLGAVLGGFGAVLGRSWRDMLSSPIFDRFLDRFWSPKGCPQGGFMGAKTGPKSTLRRGRNLRVKKLRLGSDLGRFWFVFGGCRGAFSLILCWVLYYFADIDVFDVDSRPRSILEPKMSKNGPNLEVKRVPKRD